MTKCKYFDNCPANFEVESNLNKPMSVLESYQVNYCKEDPLVCARYKVMEEVGKELLPTDLQPHHHEQAEQIINNNQ